MDYLFHQQIFYFVSRSDDSVEFNFTTGSSVSSTELGYELESTDELEFVGKFENYSVKEIRDVLQQLNEPNEFIMEEVNLADVNHYI